MGQLNRPLTRARVPGRGIRAVQSVLALGPNDAGTDRDVAARWRRDGAGGLLDLFGASDTLAAVSVSSPALFLQGEDVRSNVIPPGANLSAVGHEFLAACGSRRAAAGRQRDGVDGWRQSDPRGSQSARSPTGCSSPTRLQLNGSLPPLAAVFPGTSLGNQLKEVARLIRVRSQMGPGRQVFFCSMGGFDTHSSQDWTHWNLLQQLSQALYGVRLRNARARRRGPGHHVHAVRVQPDDAVQRQRQRSCLGRHQFVLGGAVRGGIYGADADVRVLGPDDANNRGVWIPTIAAAQFGATLGKWFGATAGELDWAFPNLSNFPIKDVGFMG